MIATDHPRELRPRRAKRGPEAEQGMALLLALTSIAILTVMVADMHENVGTSFAIAQTERDELRAEYMAKSALNLTRMLRAQGPAIRQVVAPFYQMLLGRPPGQIPVWRFANDLLKPFCSSEEAQSIGANIGINFGSAKGLSDLSGSCTVVAFAENGKINVNDPLLLAPAQARLNLSMQLYALMGGYQPQSAYDPLFSGRDRDGLLTTRLDVISALIDWWDTDTVRTTFDPVRPEVAMSGAEDDPYSSLSDPYRVKNAPFDSLEELRLVRGIGDDFWATFIEPDPDDPDSRKITIYGSGLVNVNEAPPEVLLARVCSVLVDQTLCNDLGEAAKFVQLLRTVRAMAPIPFFPGGNEFVNFLEGRGGPNELYPMLQAFLGAESPLLFKAVTVAADKRRDITRGLVASAEILTIIATGTVCTGDRCTESILRTMVNFHDRWTPPPPNSGSMPGLGVIQYYRQE